MIIRTVHNRDNPYFQIDRTAVNDERLSYKAIGIYVYLMSKPDGWEANESDIATRHTDGRAAIRSGIQELIEYGYMVRVQIRKDKKVVAWRLDTYETPELNPHYKQGQPAKSIVIDLDTQDLECENLNVGSSNNVHLECEKLQVEKLDVGNRIHSNYTNTETNELKGIGVQSEAPLTVTPPPPLALPDDANGFNKLMDAARNRNNGAYGKVQAVVGEQVRQARKFGVSEDVFREITDIVLDGMGKLSLANSGDDESLVEGKDVALALVRLHERYRTPTGVKMIFDTWVANGEFKGKPPSRNQVKGYASQILDGKIIAKPKVTQPAAVAPVGVSGDLGFSLNSI